MYRSSSTVNIYREDIVNSASWDMMYELGSHMSLFRGLMTGVSMFAIVALTNTVSTEDVLFKNKPAFSTIIEKTEGNIPYQVLTDVLEGKMPDYEFNKAMEALKNIWNACPEDLPSDLSVKHDHYLFGVKG